MNTGLNPPKWVPLSSPGPKRPLVPRVERAAQDLRHTAATVDAHWPLIDFDSHYRPARDGLGYEGVASASRSRAAWALLGEWVCASVILGEPPAGGLAGAHRWFWRGWGCADAQDLPSAPVEMGGIASPDELRALAPYLLDPSPAATRRDVLREQPDVRNQRLRRKASGVYYTPGDVAWLMVQRVIEDADHETSWLDPAVGSGVFLRCVMGALDCLGSPFRAIEVPLYGIDVSPQAAESAAFVLCMEILLRSDGELPPWQAWHAARTRLATQDSLLLRGLARESDESGATAVPTRGREEGDPRGRYSPTKRPAGWFLTEAFPELAGGLCRVISNPPYAPLGPREDSAAVLQCHPVTGSSARDVSPMIVESAMGILGASGALTVVMPLSAIVSTQRGFVGLRRVLFERFNHVEMLSFDRAPDALFGDDIKTRNSIITAQQSEVGGADASALIRWTSRNRWQALSSIATTSVANLTCMPVDVPKIGRTRERDLFELCLKHQVRLAEWITSSRAGSLAELAVPTLTSIPSAVAIGPTAYNFISGMRDPHAALALGHTSESAFLGIEFRTSDSAAAAYAVLSSRLAHWLWQVTGDGFHVSKRFVVGLPVPVEDSELARSLARLGEALWSEAVCNPSSSQNRGKTSIAFPASKHPDLIDSIDTLCLSAVGALCGRSVLREWYEERVVVYDEPRRLARLERGKRDPNHHS